tara:strand:- start:196 stop:1017 length:822 start_codon:yes stop_codon:yes gene_type:complete
MFNNWVILYMYLLYVTLVLFFSCSSKTNPKEDVDVVARVNNTVLTKKELNRLTGNNFDNSKTLLHAANRWVERTLLYNSAIKNSLQKDKSLINQKEEFYKDLLIASYLNIIKKNKIVVNKKEISDYYNKNKKGFTRLSEEILVRHFILKSKKEAEKIKKIIKKNKKGKEIEKIIKDHQPQRKLLDKSLVSDNLVGFVFNANINDIVGPKKHNGKFHLFQLLKRHKKGSVRGLEFVYDEIYQRLFKQKEALVFASVLDSLYTTADVYISPEVFK